MNHVKLSLMIAVFLSLLAACASVTAPKRTFLDSTTGADRPPEWARKTEVVWEKDGKIFLKARYSIRGDERVNGCLDLARLDAREALLTELSTDIRGSLDQAQQSISESAELVLGKVRSGEYRGRVQGVRFNEEYFERYTVGEQERVDCHVLASISHNDYVTLKRNVISGMTEADPRLRDAILNKQVDFFAPKEQALVSKRGDSQ